MNTKIKPMKVLHIGNIANNAYLNAKILNDNGIKSDVLCCDYYHIMGCPEWEDSDFIGDYGDDSTPNWSKLDLQGFIRPSWFVQGRKITALKYLIAKNEGSFFKTEWYGFLLKNERRLYEKDLKKYLLPFVKTYRLGIAFVKEFLTNTRNVKNKILKQNKLLLFLLSPILIVLVLLLLPIKIFLIIYRKLKKYKAYNNLNYTNKELEFELRIEELKDIFYNYQPERIEYFDESYFLHYKREYDLWKKLFNYYDIVIGYGVDGIYPLLAGKKYIAFEHGTIRNLPFLNDDLGLRTLLSYKYANGVIVTNADNIEAAKKLELKNYSFIPHPINEAPLKLLNNMDYENLYEKYNTNFIVFHPSRQHWEKDIRHPDWEKGNDIFIEGFAKFVKQVNQQAIAIFIEWGQKVQESKELIKKLDIEENIVWIKPMNNFAMIRTILSSDLVADQFYLGAFGSTTPKALMCGKPAMLYLNESLHEWCFDEMPPVLNTMTSEDVFGELTKLYTDKNFAKKISSDSKDWYMKYHSNELIKDRLIDMIDKILNTNEVVN